MNAKKNIPVMFFIICLALSSGCAGVKIGGSSETMNRHAMVRDSLNKLMNAYEFRNAREFSSLVSERYTGDSTVLDISVGRDFSAHHDLTIRYIVNNITLDSSGGKAFVALNFTRGWTDIKTGKRMNETRQTSMVFILENGVYKLFTQNRPFLFGLN